MTEFDKERQDEVASTEQLEDGVTSEESQGDVQPVMDSDVEVAQPDRADASVEEEPAPEVDESPSFDEAVEEIEGHEGESTETELVDEDQAEESEEQPSKVDASEEEELEDEHEGESTETELVDEDKVEESEEQPSKVDASEEEELEDDHEGESTETELVDEDQAEESEEQSSKVDTSEEEELEDELEADSLEDETNTIDDEQTEKAETEVEETVIVPPPEPDDDRAWFVVHCYSGYENKVRHNLEQRIETMGMKNKIFDVVVPTEEEIEVKDGKRRTVERRVFPGYILVQMIMNEDSWYVVRNTPGVTGFVGMGNDPTPLRPEEVSQIVKRMEADAPRIKVAYAEGQKVRIIDGPFNDFIGTVADIDMERAKVRVMVSFFGRETPVELDFLQVDKA
jgi:transcriptional antiterminator NusG